MIETVRNWARQLRDLHRQQRILVIYSADLLKFSSKLKVKIDDVR
jgi:hypothetical protein